MKNHVNKYKEYYFNNNISSRYSGILMHISSLPGPFGIGSLGNHALDFIDFLSHADQKFWQILPVNPTGYGDSPYQSFSLYAGNPYLIDLENLISIGLLDENTVKHTLLSHNEEEVDYYLLYKNKLKLLKMAYENNIKLNKIDIDHFLMLNSHWAIDYALFMTLKTKFLGKPRCDWPIEYKFRNHDAIERLKAEESYEIYYHIFMQAVFYEQYFKIKEYANSKGIKIIGDIPIYAADDSVDIWMNPKYFKLDENLDAKFVGGCPPDDFSITGQLWGNPVYNWQNIANDDYSWWINRLRHCGYLYDIIRVDHFRGFESFWQVPKSEETAVKGSWIKAPGYELFDRVKSQLPHIEIIAEDLGYMTKEIDQFRKHTGFPGMKVLQFAWDPYEESSNLPHNIDYNWVVYTGTHDNDTTKGFFDCAPKINKDYAIEYLKLTEAEGYTWGFIRGAWACSAKYAIAPMQDFLELGNEARMNEPSTMGNWKWRAKKNVFTKELAEKIRRITLLYGRSSDRD